MAYRTTAAYVSGALCGHMWMPEAMAGKPHTFNLRARIDRFSAPASLTFRQMLMAELMENGGDFQDARFTADTVVRVERRSATGPGKYTVHVWERTIDQLRDCDDLVNASAYTSDFMGED